MEIMLGIIIGVLFSFVIYYIVTCLKLNQSYTTPIILDDPTDDTDYLKLHNTAHCPDCGSYNLTLVDRYSGVPWARGGDDGDYYSCTKCGRQFSDEEWQNAKSTTVDLSGTQD